MMLLRTSTNPTNIRRTRASQAMLGKHIPPVTTSQKRTIYLYIEQSNENSINPKTDRQAFPDKQQNQTIVIASKQITTLFDGFVSHSPYIQFLAHYHSRYNLLFVMSMRALVVLPLRGYTKAT